MYRRYTNTDREGGIPNRFKQTLIRDIIIVLLLAGLVVLLIKAVPAMKSMEDYKSAYIRRIMAEYSETTDLSYENSISLSELRSRLYSIQVLNDLYTAQYKQPLIDEKKVEDCIEAVKENLAEVSKGASNNSLPQTKLREALKELKNELSQFE